MILKNDQFAVKAFHVSAVDYLLKPVDSSNLICAVAKAKKALEEKKGRSKAGTIKRALY